VCDPALIVRRDLLLNGQQGSVIGGIGWIQSCVDVVVPTVLHVHVDPVKMWPQRNRHRATGTCTVLTYSRCDRCWVGGSGMVPYDRPLVMGSKRSDLFVRGRNPLRTTAGRKQRSLKCEVFGEI
jgi:hypothetical protein